MNGAMSSTMEELTESTLSDSLKPKELVADDCQSLNDNNHVNDNRQNVEDKDNIKYSKINDIQEIKDSNIDKKCDEKILNTEINNIPEKHNVNVVENNINSNKPIVEFSNSSEVTPVEAEPEKDNKVLVMSNDNPENQTDSHYVIEQGKDSLTKDDHENSELEGAQEVITSLEVLCGDCDDGSVEQSSSNETCLKVKEKDLFQEHHEDITQNERIQSVSSLVVQEILSDNDKCVMEVERNYSTRKKRQLHSSNRYEELKKYDNVEKCDTISDVEVVTVDNLWGKQKPILVRETKTLLNVAARQLKAAQSIIQKNKPAVVFIDTKSGESNKPIKSSINSNAFVNPQNLYQSIIIGGASITPIRNKSSLTAQKSSDKPQPTANQHILPSLTDDMFVVEAPSFIVPYVYEKPSIKPFREYVDILGKELKDKELKELMFKEEKGEIIVKKEYFDGYEESQNEDTMEVKEEIQCDIKEENIKKEPEEEERAGQKRCRNDNDDASWDGKSSSDVNENVIREEDEDKKGIIKVKTEPDEKLINVSGLTIQKVETGKPDNYFDRPLGTFFIDIGLNLVQEIVQNDLLKEQNRKLNREKKSGHNTRATESSIISLTNNLELSKKNNASYQFKQHKCSVCGFKTNSLLVMEHHMETPHMRNNVYRCNYCTFAIKSPHEILQHMDVEHNVKGKLERAFAYHQCVNCPFEDNGKGKLARHQISCAKKFKPELNLAPPLDWEPPAKIPKITKSRNNLMGPYPSAFHRSVTNSPIRAARVPGSANTTVQQNGGCVKVGGSLRVNRSSPVPTTSRVTPVHGAPMIRSGVVRNNASLLLPVNSPSTSNCKNVGTIKSLAHHPSISVTPLPRQSRTTQPQQSHQSKNSYVVCEICDGYIKDLEQLRNHMQWIHKVKIHPKMIYNRPPLNCQKCRCRFFTDQGLERHLLGSHGLVTNSMQQAANKKRDAGRCPVCGRVYQWKLLNHVSRDHNLTLKPAHLSYKCTVCAGTFATYKQFENHVYASHSVVAKCAMGKDVPKKSNDSLLKPLKISDEITITPSPDKD